MADISVIICTRNRSADLRQTLEAFRAVEIPPGLSVELLVVDNGSSDSTAEVTKAFRLSGFEIRYLPEPQTGQAIARNTGIRAATGEIIVFTDDDVRPSAGWLENLTRPIRDGKCDLSVGAVHMAEHLERPWMQYLHRMWLACVTPPVEGVVCATGANFAFSRRVLEKVPAFDPELGPGQLGFYDDTLFSRQIGQAGFRLLGVPEAGIVHHFHPDRLTRQAFLARAFGEGRSIAYLDWHWVHEEVPTPKYLGLRKRMKLFLLRRLRAGECRAAESCPDWELSLVQQIGFFSQYLIERQRPRAYEKFGLRKISNR